jgi:hypothetical protein
VIVNKKCCREKLILEKRLVFKKKAKNFVKRGCKWKNVEAYETNAQFCRILVIPFRRSAGDIFGVNFANLTNTYKVKDNIWT